MEYSPDRLGWKLFGLYYFSQNNLFHRSFVIFSEEDNQQQIIDKLAKNGFKDNDEVAIRFSKGDNMNLPFFLGKFTIKDIAKIIERERKDYVPFVHSLVKTKFVFNLYYNGEEMILEVWPGIGASKKNIFNENPDIIKIDKKIVIARYLRNRLVENIEGEKYSAEPFKEEFLINLARSISFRKEFFNKMRKIHDPILCDAYCESLEDINFTAIQDIRKLGPISLGVEVKDFYFARSLDELKRYDQSKELFLDIPLNRNNENWQEIISIIQKLPRVYLKSITMHLAIILRESGVNVERSISKDYEIKEFPSKEKVKEQK